METCSECSRAILRLHTDTNLSKDKLLNLRVDVSEMAMDRSVEGWFQEMLNVPPPLAYP